MDNPIKCENCGKVIAKLINGNFKEIDPDWGMSEDERELCGECYKKEKIMEHPTKEEALKELAGNFWWDDENWKNLEDYIFNTVESVSDVDPKDHNLYFAAIGLDRLEEYLEKYYDRAEEAEHIRTFKVCKDCYDYITSEDPGMVADVFTHYYGEEEGGIRFLDVSSSVDQIEKDGKFLREVPELVNTFSSGQCNCCKSTLHGERFFMIFLKGKKQND